MSVSRVDVSRFWQRSPLMRHVVAVFPGRCKVVMFVRLTRKLAEVVNGIDISAYAEGDVIELSSADAQLPIAERWAEPLADAGLSTRSSTWRPDARAVAADRGRPAGRDHRDHEDAADSRDSKPST